MAFKLNTCQRTNVQKVSNVLNTSIYVNSFGYLSLLTFGCLLCTHRLTHW